MSVIKEIESKIKSGRKGEILFISDFVKNGDYEIVKKSLQRLIQQDFIIRLSKGIYLYPKTDKILGVLLPSVEQIAKAIAKRDKARIIPTGAYALYRLGLSTQVPMNIVYLTDGSPRKISVGHHHIVFKKTSPKNLDARHPLSHTIIQGLKALGKENITERELEKIHEIIEKSGGAESIERDLQNAPVWIQQIILQKHIYDE